MQESGKSVLVGIDFSPASELALNHAARLAERLQARLDLVYIHQPVVIGNPEFILVPPDQRAAIAGAERQLRELAARFADRVHFQVHARIGEPVSGLLELAAERAPEFLVVGSHGRGLVMRVLLGSVAEQLCRRSHTPVVVIPAAERAAKTRAGTALTPAGPEQERMPIRVSHIMTPNPRCCTPDTNLGEIAQRMLDSDCGEIPVVDGLDTRVPVGVITDRDIVCRAVAQGKNPLELRARDCMSRPVITVTPETSIEECCKLMAQYRLRRMPVVDEKGRCCGLVAQADLAKNASARKTAELVKEVSQTSYV